MRHASRFDADGAAWCGYKGVDIRCYWPETDCRVCLGLGAEDGCNSALTRLAELDRAQAMPVKIMGDTVTLNGQVIGRVQPFGGPSFLPADDVRVEYVAAGTNDVTQRTVDVALLTRLSDFIASIPGNALDRKGNALAMQLRREIADVVCPADKVRG